MDKLDFAFSVRALEIHSLYAWDYNWIIKTMDFMREVGLNTLILHRNDFVDLIVYPGKYFGYEGKKEDTIFETYSQIFRKLYQYTPTRRSGPYQRRAFLRRVLEQAKRRGIAVYIENKELYFPDILLEFYPGLVHEGHICASDPFWTEFLKVKYWEFFREFPQISGIITAVATGESRVSISSNRCKCSRCRSMKKEEWFDNVIRAMYEPIHQAGKTLVIRDFVFDPKSHREIASVMERLPGDVVISLKNTPHDYYPTFPENGRIGQVGEHRQWIEYDAMGQYFGWGIAIADMTDDYRRRMRSAKEKGAEGIILRTDWESLDGHTAFQTPNRINVYAGAMLSKNPHISGEEIYRYFLKKEAWVEEKIEESDLERCVKWFGSLMGGTWEAVSAILFVQGCVFSDSSLMPVSPEHAFWLAEEKNSLKAWEPDKADVLEPDACHLEAALEEKREGLKRIAQMCRQVMEPPKGIKSWNAQWIQERFWIYKEFAEMYVAAMNAILLTRYVLETQENHETEYYLEKQKQQREAIAALDGWEKRLKIMMEETNYIPHTVYTLMDPDRMRCLYGKLKELEDKTWIL